MRHQRPKARATHSLTAATTTARREGRPPAARKVG
jgi:hypothetical protein